MGSIGASVNTTESPKDPSKQSSKRSLVFKQHQQRQPSITSRKDVFLMNSQSTQNTITEPTQEAAFPIASETTKTDQEQTERPNKYLYPVFAGYGGERYLDSILQHILPNALSRTWRYAVDFQAPGRDCYVGAAKIADRVKPGVRKIEIDLHELERRGLMRRYAARRPFLQEDGSGVERAVVVKDFTSLYGLAYDYH